MREKDYEATAEWAEHDVELAHNSDSSLRRQEAAAFGRELIEHSQGR